jgi:hypothetical protein
MANKIDSNITGLRFAEETTPKSVSGAAYWYPLEPNSYANFGGALATMARNPINANRSRKKGTITDLDATGGFNQDITQNNLTRLLQGFLFADIREKPTSQPMNGVAIPITSTTTTTYVAASGFTFLPQHLVFGSGFATAANNGLKLLTAASATTLTTTGNAVETPPASAKVEAVGYEFASATLDVVMSAGLPRLTRMSGTVDFTTLGLVAGEWIYVGGDVAANQFTNNRGFARVNAVAATYIELDKTDWTPQAEVGTAKNIRIFFGSVLKNEVAALIKKRTYQLERTIGADANGTMSEYLTGASPNDMTITVKQADKVTADLTFVAADIEQRTGLVGVKTGTRPSIVNADAYNTTSDFSRIKLSLVDIAQPNPTALFAFATDMTLNLKNNVTPNKAIGTLGAFDTSAGTFELGGSLTAYFADTTSVAAVRNNSDVTLDFILAKNNAGIAIDVPLIGLGDGQLNVAQDQAITVPLTMNAAESKYGHTLLMSFFSYLPTVAM